jgi:hypothetical protein
VTGAMAEGHVAASAAAYAAAAARFSHLRLNRPDWPRGAAAAPQFAIDLLNLSSEAAAWHAKSGLPAIIGQDSAAISVALPALAVHGSAANHASGKASMSGGMKDVPPGIRSMREFIHLRGLQRKQLIAMLHSLKVKFDSLSLSVCCLLRG